VAWDASGSDASVIARLARAISLPLGDARSSRA
jgi:hypothetical protein